MENIYRSGIIATALSILLSVPGFAQDETPAPPAKPDKTETIPPVSPDENPEILSPIAPVPPLSEVLSDQGPAVIIMQKGKKTAKITVELNGGDVRVNGKPISEFRDKNITVSRIPRGTINVTTTTGNEDISLFRDKAMSQADLENIQLNLNKQQHDVEVNVERTLRKRNMDLDRQNQKLAMAMANEAYLGVGSKKSAEDGALVVDISPAGPAEKAGLKKGDVITKVNDKTVHNPDDLFKIIHQYKPGDKVTVTCKREGKELVVTAILEKSKGGPVYDYNYRFRVPEIREFHGWNDQDFAEQPKLGLKAQDNEDGKGVDVIEVVPGSAAEKAGLKKGDNIVRFDGDDVNSAEELADHVRENRGKARISVNIIRDGKPLDLEIHNPRKLKTEEL